MRLLRILRAFRNRLPFGRFRSFVNVLCDRLDIRTSARGGHGRKFSLHVSATGFGSAKLNGKTIPGVQGVEIVARAGQLTQIKLTVIALDGIEVELDDAKIETEARQVDRYTS